MNADVYEPTQQLVAQALIDAGVVQVKPDQGEAGWARWRGHRTPVGMDFGRLGTDPGAAAIVVSAMANAIRVHHPDAAAIIGVPHTGLYVAARTAAALSLEYVAVRFTPAGYEGGSNPAEALSANARVVIVDDYIATGATCERVARLLAEERHASLLGAMGIVSLGQRAAHERAHRLSMPFRSLVRSTTMLRAAVDSGLLPIEAAAEVERFYRAPEQNNWDEARLP